MTEIEEELTETLYRRDNKIKKYKQALEEIRERAQSSLDKADSYIILKIINEVLNDRN